MCARCAAGARTRGDGGGVTSAFERPPAAAVLALDMDSRAPRGRRALSNEDGENDAPSQVHLTPTGIGEVTVTWATRARVARDAKVSYRRVDNDDDSQGTREAKEATMTSDSYTAQICFGSGTLFAPRMGQTPSVDPVKVVELANTSAWAATDAVNYRIVRAIEDVIPSGFFASAPYDKGVCLDYNNPDAQYHSPLIHTAKMRNLVGGSRVAYTLPGSSISRTFTVPTVPSRHPSHHRSWTSTRIAVVGDTGQTEVTREVLTHVAETLGDAQVLIHTGDLAYADGFAPRWDSFGRLMEFVTSTIPMLSVVGNHDVSVNGLESTAYAMRYPSPHVSSKSPSQLFWSYEVGHAHVIGLNSYANPDVGVFDGADAPQMSWLLDDLASINREFTPWVIAVFHVPWYNSNRGHFKEAERARLALEQILYDAGVDVILNGHVHAYERSKPVFNYAEDACGPVHIVIGDGGNYEGPYGQGWIEPQPSFSAFREGSFGAGSLLIHNDTHATWEWRRTTCVANTTASNSYFERTGNASTCRTIPDVSAQAMEPVDIAVLRRDVDACPNKLVGNAARSNDASGQNAEGDSNHVTTLVITSIVLLALWVGTSVMLIRTLRVLKYSRAYRSPSLLANSDDFDDEFAGDGAIGLHTLSSSMGSDKI
jgi:predicted phosphodiesterase